MAKALVKISAQEEKKLRSFQTKSAGIRYLASLDMRNGDIARWMSAVWNKEVRPQHVSNVLHTEVKNPTEK